MAAVLVDIGSYHLVIEGDRKKIVLNHSIRVLINTNSRGGKTSRVFRLDFLGFLVLVFG